MNALLNLDRTTARRLPAGHEPTITVAASRDERQAHPMATTEEIINEARNGRMFILVDDEDRENEGDLIIPAQMATPEAINFMAMHGRGLICLALGKDRVDQLALPLMSRRNGGRHETAFTVSIEAKDGVTTGISAADRARTIAVAIDGSKGADHLVSPGHMFPLVARPGGVLVRAGHTEAAVDVSRLAGLNPSGVICEIMKDDGTMARLDNLIDFARHHKLKIGTIRDLIAYRRRHDHLVEKVAEAPFHSEHGGEWQLMTYRSRVDGRLSTVLQKGRVMPDVPTLVRMHRISLFDDILRRSEPQSCPLRQAMEEIGRAGAGVILVNDAASGSLIGGQSSNAREGIADLYSQALGAQILTDLGVNDIMLLTDTDDAVIPLLGCGLKIVGTNALPLPARMFPK